MGLREIGFWLLVAGAVLGAVGGVLWLAGLLGLPLGRLPGDVSIRTQRGSFHFPVVTCIIISLVLTVLLNLALRFFR